MTWGRNLTKEWNACHIIFPFIYAWYRWLHVMFPWAKYAGLVPVHVCVCLGVCVRTQFRHLLSLPIASVHVWLCASVCVNSGLFRSLLSCECWLRVMQFSPELEEPLGNETLWGSRVIGKVMITVGGQNNSLTLFIHKWLLLCLGVSRTILSIDYMSQQ